MAKRMQSASSIKTYKQCPRKYYYQYIQKLPTQPSIHLVRGSVTHKVLEGFFEINPNQLDQTNYSGQLKETVQTLLIKYWKESARLFAALDISDNDKIKYFEETMMMLLKWADDFVNKLGKLSGSIAERFQSLTPIREAHYRSDILSVQGFIDAIQHVNGEVRLMDYKTSNTFDIEEHRLQLAIYSMLYFERHKRLPGKVGIYFLKMGEQWIDCDPYLVEMARKEVEEIHKKTIPDHVDFYPKCPGPLCKFSTGKCDFYETCKPFEKEVKLMFEKERKEIQEKLLVN